MNVLIVHAHPEPRSFASALAAAAAEELRARDHVVEVSDLFAMDWEARLTRADFLAAADADYFKPQREQLAAAETLAFAPDVRAEIDKVRHADVLIFTFPLWWFSIPAILKGWFDRVFAMGIAYGGGRVHETGPLRGKRALLALTTGGPASAFGPEGRSGDLRALLAPVEWGTLHFAGCDVLAPFVVWGPARASDEDRAAALVAWRERLRGLENEAPEALRPPGR